MAEEKIYIILGHGLEESRNFESRDTVPEGTTIVTLAQAGTVSRMPEVCKTMQLFSEEGNRDLLKDPKKNKQRINEEIGIPVHVYTEGRKYPDLEISPLAFWNIPAGNQLILQLLPSGTYEFPLQKEKQPTTVFHEGVDVSYIEKINASYKSYVEQCSPFIHYFLSTINDEILNFLYKDSLLPTLTTVKSKKTYSADYIGAMHKMSLKSVIETLGKGIYYYVICRASNKDHAVVNARMQTYIPPIGALEEYFPDGIDKATLDTYKKSIESFLRKVYTEKDMVARTRIYLEEHEKLPFELQKRIFEELDGEPYEKTNYPKKLTELRRFLNRFTLIRSKSIEQQNMNGGKRNRKRKTRKLQRKSSS